MGGIWRSPRSVSTLCVTPPTHRGILGRRHSDKRASRRTQLTYRTLHLAPAHRFTAPSNTRMHGSGGGELVVHRAKIRERAASGNGQTFRFTGEDPAQRGEGAELEGPDR